MSIDLRKGSALLNSRLFESKMGKNVHDITKQRTLKERPILCMPTVSIGHDRMLL